MCEETQPVSQKPGRLVRVAIGVQWATIVTIVQGIMIWKPQSELTSYLLYYHSGFIVLWALASLNLVAQDRDHAIKRLFLIVTIGTLIYLFLLADLQSFSYFALLVFLYLLGVYAFCIFLFFRDGYVIPSPR